MTKTLQALFTAAALIAASATFSAAQADRMDHMHMRTCGDGGMMHNHMRGCVAVGHSHRHHWVMKKRHHHMMMKSY